MKSILSAFAWLLLLAELCIPLSGARSQTTILPVDMPSDIVSGGSGFSPSIASFNDGGTKLATAYSYKYASTKRRVAVSTSTDKGVSWTVSTALTFPHYGANTSDNDIDNMDDAQIISCDGPNLVLVVRAWASNSGFCEGGIAQEQLKSIYKKVGIYLCVSTDGGATWGAPVSGIFSAGDWMIVSENNPSNFSTDHTTLEWPRIAYRKNAGIISYPYDRVTSATGTLSPSGSATNFSDMDIVRIGGINYQFDASLVNIWANHVQIGATLPISLSNLAAAITLGAGSGSAYSFATVTPNPFARASISGSDMLLEAIQPGASGNDIETNTSSLPVVFSGATLSGGGRETDQLPPQGPIYVVWTKKTFTPGSGGYTAVAASIGYSTFYGNADPASAFGAWAGTYAAPSLSSTSGTSGPERASVAISPDGAAWLGYYCCNYDISGSAGGPWADFYAYNLKNSTGKKIANHKSLSGSFVSANGYLYSTMGSFFGGQWDLASGPSIQFACDQAQFNCEPDYHFGYAFSSLGASTSSTSTDLGVTTITQKLSWGSTATILNSVLWQTATLEAPDTKMRYFPVLKYAEATDNVLTYKIKDGIASGFNPSYFILAYMRATPPGSSFDNVTCMTGFSFDNTTFIDLHSNSTLQTADGYPESGCNSYAAEYGTKIDIAGLSGDLSVFPVWHKCKALSNAPDVLAMNGAGATIVKPLLKGMPGNNPSAYPTTVSPLPLTESSTGTWSTFELYQFDPTLLPPTVTGTSSTITPALGSNFGTWTWAPSSTFIQGGSLSHGSGLFYGVFEPTSNNIGVINYSDQRKAVTVGNVTFAVAEDPATGKVFLTQSMGLEKGALGSPNNSNLFDQIPWTQPVQIETTTSGVTQSNPAIGVYQAGEYLSYALTGDGGGCSGQGSVAVTWVEKQPMTCAITGHEGILTKIKLRINEFNECTGTYSWSDVYTVHSHFYDASATGALPDNTRPVIAPIVTRAATTLPDGYTPKPQSDDQAYHPDAGTPCFLLGWSITWTGPQMTVGVSCSGGTTGVDAESTTTFAMVGANADVINTGLYSRNWMRVSLGDLQITNNASWGTFHPVLQPGTPTQPMLVPDIANGAFNNLLQNSFLAAQSKQFTDLFPADGSTPGGISTYGHIVDFPSTTSSENKWRWWDDRATTNDNYRIEVAFSSDGIFPNRGFDVFHTAPKYQRVAGSPVFGTLIGQQGIIELTGLTGGGVDFAIERDRNPCVTINSSGQVFIAWESMRRSTDIADRHDVGVSTSGFWYSQIRIANTPISAPTSFSSVQTVIERKMFNPSASDFFYGTSTNMPSDWTLWLNNPSITAFPKTRSLNFIHSQGDDSQNDRDLGVVQLLYACKLNGNSTRFDIRARHYFELPQFDIASWEGNLYNLLYGITTGTPPTSEGVPAPHPTTIGTGVAFTDKNSSGLWPIANENNWDDRPGHPAGDITDIYHTGRKANTQLSHSPRQHSPLWYPGFFDGGGTPSLRWSNAPNADPGSALELTNTVNSSDVIQEQFFNYRFDAYKTLSPQDTAEVPEVEYRAEVLHTSMAHTRFAFGELTISNAHSSHEIGAAYPYDSPSQTTYKTTRDRVLSSDEFDWNTGETISYARILDLLTTESNPNYALKESGMQTPSYSVNLVLEDGTKILLERAKSDASNSDVPKHTHIINTGRSRKHVHLQCINETDPNAEHGTEKGILQLIYKEDGPYDFLKDTSLIFTGTSIEGVNKPSENSISAVFPNPITEKDQNLSFFVTLPSEGAATAALYDMLGRAIIEPQVITSNAAGTQLVSFTAPQASGVYFLKVTIGNNVTTLPVHVQR